MSAAPAPAGHESGRGGIFTLPVSTSFRFALTTAAVMASSFTIYEGIYLASPRGTAFYSLILRCRSQALSQQPSGLKGYASALHRETVCLSGFERAEALWGLLGVGVLIALAGAIYWVQPWWYRRRMDLIELAGDATAAVRIRLEELREQAGTGPVIWLIQPLNVRLSAFAFGRPRHRCIAITGGAAVAAVTQPAAFDAIVLHELAHLRNRDIDQTYLAMAMWRAFIAAAVLPMIGLLIFTQELGAPQRTLWRVAALALTVYLLRNSILRSREFDADARVRELDPGTSIGVILATMPSGGRGAWRLGWLHPSGRDRAAALLDPAPLYRCGFWDGLAIGLVAALGASAAREIVTLLTTAYSLRPLVPAAIFATFCGATLAIAMWRKQFRRIGPDTVTGWTVGLGLGIGLAIGPIVALPTSIGYQLAPDSLSPEAFGVLAVWSALAVFMFSPFPAWVGLWADAWQENAGASSPRVPARGGMVFSAVAAWLVMTIGLDLLLTSFTFIDGPSAAAAWHELGPDLTDLGIVIPLRPASWIVGLVIVIVPLAAVLVRWRRSGEAPELAPLRRRAVAVALLSLAGCLTAVTLTLATSAVARSGIAQSVRWNVFFSVRLYSFEEQAIVIVAVIFALIAVATQRFSRYAAIGALVAAAIAAVGAVALSNAEPITHCFGSLSIQYANPPVGKCYTGPDALFVKRTVIGALLLSVLLIPGATYVGGRLRDSLTRRQRSLAPLARLQWPATAAVVIAVVMAGFAVTVMSSAYSQAGTSASSPTTPSKSSRHARSTAGPLAFSPSLSAIRLCWQGTNQSCSTAAGGNVSSLAPPESKSRNISGRR
jgi:Zn-dependent protease with chaperone function